LRRGRSLRGGTFHSIACGFLRQYGSHIGLSSKFVIIDRHEAEGVIGYLRSLYASRKLPEKGAILDLISAAANRMASAEELACRISAPQGFMASISRKYS
jgi:superfamily I DNA/RNA helicase